MSFDLSSIGSIEDANIWPGDLVFAHDAIRKMPIGSLDYLGPAFFIGAANDLQNALAHGNNLAKST